MTDSALVFPAGFRVLDSEGVPLGGAQIRFFEVGLNTPKNVFSDADMGTSLGPIVYTRSDGYPVAAQDSNTTVAVYIDAGRYGIDILDEDGVTVYPAKDDQQGAVDTSSFLTSQDAATLIIPVVSIAVNSVIGASHNGKLINAAGNITLTFTSPVTLGDSWNVRVRCDDATNAIKLVAAAGTFKGPGFNLAGVSLYGLGNAYDIVCDGGAFNVTSVAPGRVQQSGRVFTCVSRVTSAPATTAGLFYLVSGAFGAFSVGDIIEGTGQTTFIGYTPPTNSGWLAFIQGEGVYYHHITGGWVAYYDDYVEIAAPANPPADTMRVYARDVGGTTHLFSRDSAGVESCLTLLPTYAVGTYAASANLTTVIPYDDTIPQIAEGTEIISISITAKRANSLVLVEFSGFAAISGSTHITAALFLDGAANAVQVTTFRAVGADDELVLAMAYSFAPGDTAAHTLAIRAGGDGSTVRFNGISSARKFGGAAAAVLTAREIYQ